MSGPQQNKVEIPAGVIVELTLLGHWKGVTRRIIHNSGPRAVFLSPRLAFGRRSIVRLVRAAE